MDEIRPEYVQAIDAARWNFWWYVATMIPPLLLVPAAVKLRLSCLAIPSAYVFTWLAVCTAVEYFWAAKYSNAVTDAEWAGATADTARAYASVIVVPFVFFYVTVVGTVVFVIASIIRGKMQDYE